MTNQEIYELMARFDASGLGLLRLSRGDFQLELEKTGTAPSKPEAVSTVPAALAVKPKPEEGPVISAPLVGTFYAAPDPKQPPFVTVGERVEKGRTVCLLEAMKTMIEVPAPCDCVVNAVLKANGELAAFGEALMRYTPC